MPTQSRYICEIHDDIDEAVKKGRIDLVAGLTEEARVAGKRMEQKLHYYSNLNYDLIRYAELKEKLKVFSTQVENIEAFIGVVPEVDPDLIDECIDPQTDLRPGVHWYRNPKT